MEFIWWKLLQNIIFKDLELEQQVLVHWFSVRWHAHVWVQGGQLWEGTRRSVQTEVGLFQEKLQENKQKNPNFI